MDSEKVKTVLIASAALALGGSVISRFMQGDRVKEPDTYHIGVETGGTSCKVGIMKGAHSLEIFASVIIPTTTPSETVEKICDFINSLPYTYSSIGIAAFGPLCLDGPDFGTITTTPKVAWQHTPLLKLILQKINA